MSLLVIKTAALREGTLVVMPDPRRLIVGTGKPTEYEAIVMDGVTEALPWFCDPLRMGAEAWKIIEQTAKDQGHPMRVKTRGTKS